MQSVQTSQTNRDIMTQNKFISIVIILSVVFSFTIINLPDPVMADAAPPPGAVGSTLFPNLDQTNVRMEAETVLMAIPEHSDYRSGHAMVTATFYMRNMGDETENIKVRFPMNMSEYDLEYEVTNKNEYCTQIYDYPSIDDFSVKIDNEETDIVTTTSTVENRWSTSENPSYTTINCWAYFDVSFPPGEQVIIEIQYKVPGYTLNNRFVSYTYVLQTGIGWYDTIGSADIVVQLPYDLDDTIILNCSPEDCTIQDKTVWWHYEDFEPEENIEISMIDPSIWSRVVRETKNVQTDASDGEAWGRLGLAYKELVTERHGFIVASEFPEFFDKSVKAYQNAVYLLPNDAEWHLGYSDLVCPYAVEAYYTHQEDAQKYAHICGVEIDTVLFLNPSNPDVIQYLKFLYDIYPAFFVENGFNIFADKLHLPTLEAVPTKVTDTSTNTPEIKSSITDTPDNPDETQTAAAVLLSDNLPTPTINPFGNVQPQQPFEDTARKQKQTWFSFFGNITILVITIGFYALTQKKHKLIH